MRKLLPFLISIIAVMVAACSHDDRDYSHWTSVPAEGWAYGDTLYLNPVDTTLPDNDTIVRRNLRLGITHTNSYPYSNLWLEVTYPSVGVHYRDTVNIRLADQYGRWVGSGFGANYQREFVIAPDATVDLTEPIIVRHIMRVDTLRGLDHIGISLN